MIAILADIHGNLAALEAVLRRVDEIGCSSVVHLGDVAGYCPQVVECIGVLRDRRAISLLGNHDFYLLTGALCPRSRSANRCLEYQSAVIDASSRAWLSQAQAVLVNGQVSMVHGSWEDPIDGYLYEVRREHFKTMPQRFFFAGHTHVQALVDFGEVVFCNPGSVGQPRDGDPRAAFAVFDGHSITLHRVEYDIDRTAMVMKDLRFEDRICESLFRGTRIGGKIDTISISR